MKKLFSLLLSLMLATSLAACGASNAAADDTTPPADTTDTTPETTPEDTTAPETTPDAAPAAEGGTLIAYFSWSGNTEQVAQTIAAQTGGELFEIQTAAPYTDDYDELLDVAQQEQAIDARPELTAQVENWDSYDTVFVGYPNWWSDAPMAIYTFLESYDFAGKTLIPFNTSASGGFGSSLDGIAQSAAGAEIAEGLALTEGDLGETESLVTEWLAALGL